MEHETKISDYTRSLRQTAVMPRFFIGQEVKTEHGIGIIVAIEMPLLENGTDLRIIQKIAGHSSSKTTEIYTHVSKQIISKVKTPI